MTVRFKGISEYRSKSKGRATRPRSDSSHQMIRQAGPPSHQTRITREPQFLSKKKVPFYPPQVSHSLQWEQHDASCQERRRPVTSPAVKPAARDSSAGRQVTPFAPRDSTPQEDATAPSQLQAKTQVAQPATATAGQLRQRHAINGVKHALRKKAGLRSERQRKGRLSSEYQRQFMWKTSVTESPLLAAHEMFYNDNRAVPPFTSKPVNPVIMESEYKRSFKGSPPPRPPRLRGDVEQHEVSQLHTENVTPEKIKRKKKKKERQLSRKSSSEEEVSRSWPEFQQQEVMSPCAPRNLSPKIMRTMKTEYRSKFCSPLQYCYRDGAWVKARTAQMEECEHNECWYHEVRELREKAEAYRKRAWGSHFSPQHLNQITSEQNWMWEPSSGTSSSVISECCRTNSSLIIEALDLASAGSDRVSSSPGPSASVAPSRRSSTGEVLQEGPTLPVCRKLAWDEEAGNKERNEVEISQDELAEEQNERNSKNRHEEPRENGNIKEKNESDTLEEPHLIPKRTFQPKVLETDSAVVEGSGGGRLHTPKLKTMQTAQRTHDRTTPATGGALLVPPSKIKSSSWRVGKNESPLGKPLSPYKNAVDGSPQQTCSKAENGSWGHFPPAAGLTTVDPLPMGEDAGFQEEPEYSKPPQTLQRQRPKVIVPSPANRIQGTMRNPEFQHNGNLGIFRPELFVFPESDSGVSDNDDKMSQISSRSAASCSMASELLDRTQRRKQEFWGQS